MQHSVVDLVLSCISVLVLMKNTGFSGRPSNPVDFMKSGGFHGKDLYLACICIGCIPNEPKIQHSVVDLVLSCISVLVLQKNTAKSTIHEIRQIS